MSQGTTKEPRIIMIHEVNELVLETLRTKTTPQDILTFDDGLYSNYMYLDKLQALPNTKIFFFSTAIVRPEIMRPNTKIINCAIAHTKLKVRDNAGLSNYMSFQELTEISELPNCFLGVHGHKHIRIIGKTMPRSLITLNETLTEKPKELLDILRKDIYEMITRYHLIFGQFPNKFCFPYNDENLLLRGILNQEYKKLLDLSGTNQREEIKLYGKGRINVSEL